VPPGNASSSNGAAPCSPPQRARWHSHRSQHAAPPPIRSSSASSIPSRRGCRSERPSTPSWITTPPTNIPRCRHGLLAIHAGLSTSPRHRHHGPMPWRARYQPRRNQCRSKTVRLDRRSAPRPRRYRTWEASVRVDPLVYHSLEKWFPSSATTLSRVRMKDWQTIVGNCRRKYHKQSHAAVTQRVSLVNMAPKIYTQCSCASLLPSVGPHRGFGRECKCFLRQDLATPELNINCIHVLNFLEYAGLSPLRRHKSDHPNRRGQNPK
jgi:hypothetical protein